MTQETNAFNPVVMIFDGWHARDTKQLMELSMPNAEVRGATGIDPALNVLEELDDLPGAYFMDAPIFGTDKIIAEQAIELIEKHKELAQDGSPQPYIFLYNSNPRAMDAARMIADQTGFNVQVTHGFNLDPVLFEQDKIESFEPFLKASKTIAPKKDSPFAPGIS